MILQFYKIFSDAKLPVWLRPYDVVATNASSGIVEAIADTISIDSLKRNDLSYTSLLDFFVRRFGSVHSSSFHRARSNFIKSLAAYSIVCYLLQIKDRHNGNILLHAEGYIAHIDFGFILANNPGNMHFESAPFKLTKVCFHYFKICTFVLGICPTHGWATISKFSSISLTMRTLLFSSTKISTSNYTISRNDDSRQRTTPMLCG